MSTAWSRPAALEPRGALDVKVQVCCAFFSGTPPTQCWSCSSDELKEHRYRDWRKLRTCRLHGCARATGVRASMQSRRPTWPRARSRCSFGSGRVCGLFHPELVRIVNRILSQFRDCMFVPPCTNFLPCQPTQPRTSQALSFENIQNGRTDRDQGTSACTCP